MRSGRGKCPQCKEIITVDLDAQEIRCPFCNALLKKSAKPVEKVRAEEEPKKTAIVPETLPVQEAPVAAPVEEAAPVVPVTPAEPPVQEEVPAAPIATEEAAPAEPAPVAEEPKEDEIGISDEELAMMDETPAGEITAEEESVAKEDEIGISDEELAMMDESANEAFSNEGQEAPAPAEDAEPIVAGSISAEAEEETPEEEAEKEADEEIAPEEPDIASHENLSLSDDGDGSLFDESMLVTPEPTAEEPEEEPAEETAEEPVEEKAEELPAEEASEPAAEEVAPTEEEALPEESAEATVEPVAEEPAEEEAPAEIALEDEPYVPTEEDMAFAATLSEVGRHGFIAPTANGEATAKQAERGYKKTATKATKAPKEKKEKIASSDGGEGVYKKPVAIIIFLLSFLATAFYFLYCKFSLLETLSSNITDIFSDFLPIIGGEQSAAYCAVIFSGAIAVISILGFTGKKGKLGFLFVLLAALITAAETIVSAKLFFTLPEAITKLVSDFALYITYGYYGLLLIGAICFLVSHAKDKDDFGVSGATLIAPLVHTLLIVAGTVALGILPSVMANFTVPENLVLYIVIGTWGVAILLTLIGVHRNTTSRSANGWLAIASLLSVVLVGAAAILFIQFKMPVAAVFAADIYSIFAPALPLIGLMGFAIADLRN